MRPVTGTNLRLCRGISDLLKGQPHSFSQATVSNPCAAFDVQSTPPVPSSESLRSFSALNGTPWWSLGLISCSDRILPLSSFCCSFCDLVPAPRLSSLPLLFVISFLRSIWRCSSAFPSSESKHDLHYLLQLVITSIIQSQGLNRKA